MVTRKGRRRVRGKERVGGETVVECVYGRRMRRLKWGMEGFMQEMTDRSVLKKEKERERLRRIQTEREALRGANGGT